MLLETVYVKVKKIKCTCPVCYQGEMTITLESPEHSYDWATGITLPQHRHICSNCNFQEYYNEPYPKIVYEEME